MRLCVLRRQWWQRHGIQALWMLVLLAVSLPESAAQTGFITIDCGATGPGANYVDPATGIVWDGDDTYVSTGAPASVAAGSAASLPVPMRTLRYFPADSTPLKNCYELQVTTSQSYLVRASFFYGNYDKQQTSSPITFQLALDSTPWATVSVDPSSSVPQVLEAITVPVTRQSLSVCLIRTDDSSTPFINSLEVRLLGPKSYTHSPTGGNLHLISRANFGERVKTYRFPQDPADRIWPPYAEVYPNVVANGLVTDISTSQVIRNSQASPDELPGIVMQTAITSPLAFNFTNTLPEERPITLYFSLFFVEFNATMGSGDKLAVNLTWSFLQYPDGTFAATFHLDISPSAVPPLTPYEARFYNVTPLTQLIRGSQLTTYILKNEKSTRAPVLSAAEFYSTQALAIPTNDADGKVLRILKTVFSIPTWVGDPCFPVSWEEIQCDAVGRITSLSLAWKNLTGEIPIDISDLTALRSLNLSGNGLSGAIPTDLRQLSSLRTLDVSNNQLTGAFPSWVTFLSLTSLNVSNNDLSGTFPDSLFELGAGFRYSGNSKLFCSGPSCPLSPPPGIPPIVHPAPTKKTSSFAIGPVVGGIVGAIVIIVLVGLLAIWYCRRPRSSSKPSPQATLRDGPRRLQLASRGQAQPYTLRAIQIATNNFSKQIGAGGFGSVFYGVFDSREVAVKKLSAASKQGLKEFAAEIELLSAINHKNLVSLWGYCQESSELILLYEYMGGGDLMHRLHGLFAEHNPLSWKQRLLIAVQAAKGLEYLHHGCTPSVIHRDIKSTNILLTKNLEAKFSDFGLSKITDNDRSHVTTVVKGTLGYLDPEYYQTGMLTDKSDVYSFGVVLLEIMCGRPPVVPDEGRVAANEGSLSDRVRAAMSSGDIHRVVDPRLAGQYQPESVWKFAETAMSCVRLVPSQRPSIVKVVMDLARAKDIEDINSEGDRSQSSKHSVTSAGVGSSTSGGFSSYASSRTGDSRGSYLAEEMPSHIFHSALRGGQPAPR